MKIFAIMLLMLVSATFLKAQTMVVETADGVESFEVGEIKGMSAFKKQYYNIKIEFVNIPMNTFKVIGKDTIERKQNNYSFWQPVIIEHVLKYNSGRLYGSTGSSGMNFVLIDDNKIDGGMADFEKIDISFDTTSSQIDSMYFETTGSNAACYDQYNKASCIISGRIQVALKGLVLEIDSAGKFSSILKKIEIENKIKNLYYREHKDMWGKDGSYSMNIERIIFERLTDDSQIIITIE
ncbi:MAG TPA: hypothetical protein VEC36_11995 [Patescibacteria group bacterium]|nr:hypothetical protein [Patescibacteria group bacterium]